MVEEATNTNIVPWAPPPSDGPEAKKRGPPTPPLIQSSAAFTSADGSYSFAVPPGSYTLTPSIEQDWYTFSPANLTFNNIADDPTGIGKVA